MSFFQESHCESLRAFLDAGYSFRGIAAQYGCDEATVRRFVKRWMPEEHAKRSPLEPGSEVPEPRLLVIDIETMANLVWSWETHGQRFYFGDSQVVKHKRTICFAAKWVGVPNVMFASEFHQGREAMFRAAWDLMNEADAVIGYNSKRFDVKHLAWEFKREGLGPPSHFMHIDLYTVARREWALGSYKLDSLVRRLELGHKQEHEGFGLWLRCEAGDEDAWRQMRAYNVQDVKLTERLFEDCRAWVPLRGVQSQRRLRELVGT